MDSRLGRYMYMSHASIVSPYHRRLTSHPSCGVSHTTQLQHSFEPNYSADGVERHRMRCDASRKQATMCCSLTISCMHCATCRTRLTGLSMSRCGAHMRMHMSVVMSLAVPPYRCTFDVTQTHTTTYTPESIAWHPTRNGMYIHTHAHIICMHIICMYIICMYIHTCVSSRVMHISMMHVDARHACLLCTCACACLIRVSSYDACTRM